MLKLCVTAAVLIITTRSMRGAVAKSTTKVSPISMTEGADSMVGRTARRPGGVVQVRRVVHLEIQVVLRARRPAAGHQHAGVRQQHGCRVVEACAVADGADRPPPVTGSQISAVLLTFVSTFHTALPPVANTLPSARIVALTSLRATTGSPSVVTIGESPGCR